MQRPYLTTTIPVIRTDRNPLLVDLSVANTELDSIPALDTYIDKLIKAGYLPWGGYAEHRSFYSVSPIFNNTTAFREIHLGVDLWAPVGTDIYAPLNGQLVGVKNNDGIYDYGGTLIMKHADDGNTFYTLYGHLSTASLNYHARNSIIKAGTKIAELGDKEENGGWYSHLHFQVILDLEGYVDDYPGVCTREEASFKLANCPNPIPLLPFLQGLP